MTARSVIAWVSISMAMALQSAPVLGADESPPLHEVVEAWLASPHADETSESFRHWDDDGEIPKNCATCHSSVGYRDYLGSGSSVAGVTINAVPPRSTVDCVACHNSDAENLDAVLFPSGVLEIDLGVSSRCAVCHQGRSSTVGLDQRTEGLDLDTPNPELSFVNVHYRAAAATLLGTQVKGGYEYAGKSYAGRFQHVPPLNTCIACHDPHALEVKVETCSSCHPVGKLKDIRTSQIDHDNDGDITEGIHSEIVSLHRKLGEAISAYSTKVAGVPIVYTAESYPYFFTDTNGDGAASSDETIYPNRYSSWTPRMLQAAYNFQFAAVDTGAFAHNPRYVLQLLFDSLEDLSVAAGLELLDVKR